MKSETKNNLWLLAAIVIVAVAATILARACAPKPLPEPDFFTPNELIPITK